MPKSGIFRYWVMAILYVKKDFVFIRAKTTYLRIIYFSALCVYNMAMMLNAKIHHKYILRFGSILWWTYEIIGLSFN